MFSVDGAEAVADLQPCATIRGTLTGVIPQFDAWVQADVAGIPVPGQVDLEKSEFTIEGVPSGKWFVRAGGKTNGGSVEGLNWCGTRTRESIALRAPFPTRH
jgi:hypothetical protein